MVDNRQADTTADLLTDVFSAVDGECLLVDPSLDVLKAIGALDPETDAVSNVRVLASEDTLKSARDDFLIASALANHIDAEQLSIRAHTDTPGNTVVVDDNRLFAVLDEVGGTAVALGAADETFISDTYTSYTARFDDAMEFSLRTPGRQRVHTTLSDSLSEATAEEFETYLESLDTVSGDTVDVVSLALLAAARNKELLYDISKWGEDVGIASKATFSRTKTNLEDQGLIDTEKVPIDVGRPRLRLLIGSDSVASVADEELPGTVQRVI
jgi:hypothetical protein